MRTDPSLPGVERIATSIVPKCFLEEEAPALPALLPGSVLIALESDESISKNKNNEGDGMVSYRLHFTDSVRCIAPPLFHWLRQGVEEVPVNASIDGSNSGARFD